MFQHISNLDNVKSKKYFVEIVQLYSRLLHLWAKRNNLNDNATNSEINDNTLLRLRDLEIFDQGSLEEEKQLKKVLKIPLYEEFIRAINFEIKYHNLIGDLLHKLDPIKRKITQETYRNIKAPRIVDFFCGAGGLSLGFSQEGYIVDFANDYEDVCVQTYKFNHPEVKDDRVILGDIRNIVDHLDDYINKEIDVVVGGPPCQGFSSANQQRIIDDPRNELYKFYLKAIEKIAPKFVVMENVKGMLPFAQQVVEDYDNIRIIKGNKTLSYSVDYKILVSDDYGVAQKRQRLIFIAIRNDVAEKRDVKPLDIFKEIQNESDHIKSHILKDALDFIKPLEAPRIKNITEVDDEITGKKIDLNQFKGNENSYLKLINCERDIDYVFNHKARYTNDVNYEIYSLLDH